MHEFKIGDVVEIINNDSVHRTWKGQVGIITGWVTQMAAWAVLLDDSIETWWFPSSLKFLGTEQSLAAEALGEDYFH